MRSHGSAHTPMILIGSSSGLRYCREMCSVGSPNTMEDPPPGGFRTFSDDRCASCSTTPDCSTPQHRGLHHKCAGGHHPRPPADAPFSVATPSCLRLRKGQTAPNCDVQHSNRPGTVQGCAKHAKYALLLARRASGRLWQHANAGVGLANRRLGALHISLMTSSDCFPARQAMLLPSAAPMVSG